MSAEHNASGEFISLLFTDNKCVNTFQGREIQSILYFKTRCQITVFFERDLQ
jgi:hypothetical protein